VFDLKAPIDRVPTLDLAGVVVNRIDPMTLEITIDKSRAINDVFSALTAQGIVVQSMRNKANRLEELFVTMVEKNLSSGATA
jgi:ABC-2 type transport system ATP-binding protein